MIGEKDAVYKSHRRPVNKGWPKHESVWQAEAKA